MVSMVAMTLICLVFPSSDAFVAIIEFLSEFVTTAVETSDNSKSFLRQLLCLQEDCDDDHSPSIPRGTLVLILLIVNQCTLPVHELRRSPRNTSVHRSLECDEEEDIKDYRITEARFVDTIDPQILKLSFLLQERKLTAHQSVVVFSALLSNRFP